MCVDGRNLATLVSSYKYVYICTTNNPQQIERMKLEWKSVTTTTTTARKLIEHAKAGIPRRQHGHGHRRPRRQ